jgi:transcription antitermination factor NusG
VAWAYEAPADRGPDAGEVIADMPHSIYVLHTKAHKEDIVWKYLLSQGFEVFYPRIRVQPANPRARKVQPYFPGYLFVRADLEETGMSTFQHMPFTVGLVCFGSVAAQVPDALIAAIERQVDAINSAGGELLYKLKVGDPVVIQAGPFQGHEAIFDARLQGSDRVRVLLKFLNDRHVPMELHVGQIQCKG